MHDKDFLCGPHHSTNLARCRLTSMCGMGIGALGKMHAFERRKNILVYIPHRKYLQYKILYCMKILFYQNNITGSMKEIIYYRK